MKKKLQLTGLDCAGCAAELEEEIAATAGVISASIAFVNQTLTVEYEDESVLEAVKDKANHFEEVRVLGESEQFSSTRLDGKILLRLKNLHCAACAMDLEDELKKLSGVKSVQVDFATQTILLEAEDENAVRRVVSRANKFEKVEVLNGDEVAPKKQSHLKEIIQISVSAVLFMLGFLLELFIKTPNIAQKIAIYASFAAAYFSVGYPVLISTAKNVARGKIFDENFLMTVASVGAVCLGEYGEGVAVMLLYQTGELLQAIAVGSSRKSVAKLMELKSEEATLLKNGEQRKVRPEELKAGDVVLVKAGERIPADGVLLSGVATLDVKSLTGEAELKEMTAGENVLSGCINAGGVFEMRVEKPYEDSAVAKILDLVENSTAKKAAPEKFITKFARYYTPAVCVIALLIAFLLPVIDLWIGGGAYTDYLGERVSIALNLLVISCPCALIISVPLTYFSGIGSCARNGILVKGATYLDEAAKVKIVAFDKTGTLTLGDFEILKLSPASGVSEDALFKTAARVESGSSHPIAKAFLRHENYVRQDHAPMEIKEIAGRGLEADSPEGKILAGNAALLKENGILFEEIESVNTVVYLAKEGKYLGSIEIGDKIRPEARAVIEELKMLGIDRTVMLTGDGEKRARKIADEGGMDEISAELLPADKLKKAEQLREHGKLMYVGDGINDAPVMVAADCAVSMGKLGSAAAVEASDLVLISDNLSAVPKALRIARKTRKIVAQNIVFAIAAKAAFMIGGFFGLPLWLAVFADVGVMLLAVLNSLRMRWKIKGEK
ncbi:MAG: cadmium-translocating P-type ATPase [Clostridia bacterium]|nr:cadmium-translocating P-type ATPase [Clostridia bacterium]